MAVNEVSSTYSLSKRILSSIHPEIWRTDLSKEMSDYITNLREVKEGEHNILLAPLVSDETLHGLWHAATILRLYAVKHGRYTMSVPQIAGIKRAWDGLWEVFWGISAVKFPREKKQSFFRMGMSPCIIATPPEGLGSQNRMSVICLSDDPEGIEIAKGLQKALNRLNLED